MRRSLVVTLALVAGLLAVAPSAPAAATPAPAPSWLSCPATDRLQAARGVVLLVAGTGSRPAESFAWGYQRALEADGFATCTAALPEDGLGSFTRAAVRVRRAVLDATAGAFTPDGWLRTGDLARVRPDGRFVLAGRRSEMFIRGGYNVHPQEVEAVLGTHVAVGQVALVPRDHDVLGQVGVAVVVPAADRRPPTLEELRRHAGDRLARHQLPEDLVVRGSLPMTAGGKLDRRRLADEVR